MERWEMILSRTNKELDVVTYIREHLPGNWIWLLFCRMFKREKAHHLMSGKAIRALR